MNPGHSFAPLPDNKIRHMVMQAAVMAAQALTDVEQEPEGRLRTLMDAHGKVLAARGPGSPLSFAEFRTRLRGDLAALLPEGVAPDELDGIHLITQDGEFDDDAYDVEQELRTVLRALRATTRDGRSPNSAALEAEMDQDRFFTALTKSGRQDDYEHGRSSVIRTPAGSDTELRRLNLPASIAEFYQPVAFAAVFDRWWFPCPICRWPMKVTVRGGAPSKGRKTGDVRCFHRPHAIAGARYHFRVPSEGMPPVLVPLPAPSRPIGVDGVLFNDVTGQIPEARPTGGHRALTRGVWRWTAVPGVAELAFYDALAVRGLLPQLWPGLDAYDIEVSVRDADGLRHDFLIDVKDYTSGPLLAKKLQADGGDKGGAEWLAVPDYRAQSVPLLAGVCRELGMTASTLGELGSRICRTAGVPWE
ncbi:hypothetical protein ACFXKW_27420 [Streptomyces sp. NPDC059193]|uniref:restriction endonuclease-related protein n=1 Tax=Streptomyces sp. NPDC059193 TaxID=3346763 RepID=UPI0036BCDD17